MIYAFLALLAAAAFGPKILALLADAKHADVLKKYAGVTEPIFVFSNFPGDTTVRARAERHRALLVESGNEFGIEVIELYFREAGHGGESWQIFEKRVAEAEVSALDKWGAKLRAANPDAYRREFLRQSI